jgi:hypothetical protein
MENVKLNDAISELKELFNIPESRTWKDVQDAKGMLSFCDDKGRQFMICKKEFEREDVVRMLTKYLNKKSIVGYGIGVYPITLLYTTFEIVKL